MAYIGNTAETQGFIPAVDFFSGNGSTTAFTLSRPVASVAQVQATIENVPQNPGTAFTVSGNTITFDGAPASGTNNIYVYYTSPITQVIQPSQGTVGLTQLTATGNASSSTFLRGDNSWQVVSVTPTAISDQLNASTGYFDLPAGTTAQRPVSPVNGMIRYNTTNVQYEVYSGGSWRALVSEPAGIYSIEYLLIAGGGAGGGIGSSNVGGGGGGAGGYISSSTSVNIATAYTLTIGAGGASSTVSGSNTTGFSLTAIGGGGGGTPNGSSGGSGGGSGGGNAGAGTGTAGQGNNGAVGSGTWGGSATVGGGGGGAGSAGSGQTGGSGLDWNSLGTTRAAGGLGGNGNSGSPGANGGSNTGTGGGGGGGSGGVLPGSGGSGVAIIRYAGIQRGSGGTVTSVGGFTYHTFTTSGTFTA